MTAAVVVAGAVVAAIAFLAGIAIALAATAFLVGIAIALAATAGAVALAAATDATFVLTALVATGSHEKGCGKQEKSNGLLHDDLLG